MLFGFCVSPTQYRLYSDFPALRVEEVPTLYYFKHELAPEKEEVNLIT